MKSRRHRPLLALILMVVSAATITAAESLDMDLHLYTVTLRHAGPPTVVADNLVLTFESPDFVRYVGVAFSFENYKTIHVFLRNDYGVFVYLLPLSAGKMEISYRIVVDGLWMTDPRNEKLETDAWGNALSLAVIDIPQPTPVRSPQRLDDGAFEFILRYTPGASVYLVGDFNGWDPFMDRMSETSTGTYTTTRRLLQGTHFYYFVVNGRRMVDPMNSEFGTDADGRSASRVVVR